MAAIKIDLDSCVGCGACVKDCTVRSLALEDTDKGKRCVVANQASCMRCGHCAAICPTAAIGFDDPAYTAAEPANDVERAIMMRRSVRAFKPQALTHEELQRVIGITKYAASAKAMFPIHFTVLGREKAVKVADLLAEKYAAVPAMAPIAKLHQKGIDIILRGAPHLVVTSAPRDSAYPPLEDAVIALTTMELYAQTIGVGTTWAGFVTGGLRSFPEIASIMNLPEGHAPLSCMLLGWSDVQYKRPAPRKDVPISFVE